MCVRVKCSTSNGILSIVEYAYNEEKQPEKNAHHELKNHNEKCTLDYVHCVR